MLYSGRWSPAKAKNARLLGQGVAPSPHRPSHGSTGQGEATRPALLHNPTSSFDVYMICIYGLEGQFTWHEPKRRTNLTMHGLDFVDAEEVFVARHLLSRTTDFSIQNSAL